MARPHYPDPGFPDERHKRSAGGGEARGTYQLNVDGQQVTNYVQYNRANPRYSRDAIAEFEFIANRFDATQGRSMGVQVNAVTKSGTNTPAGSFSGYFRHDRLNAPDHVVGRRLEYANQQLSGTFGGPIRRDRVHFFVNYEYEREPQTSTWTTPYPRFNIDLVGTRWERKAGLRLDVQFSTREPDVRAREQLGRARPLFSRQCDDDAREHRRGEQQGQPALPGYDARDRHPRPEPDQGGIRRQRAGPTTAP